jgi:hypothetical protein
MSASQTTQPRQPSATSRRVHHVGSVAICTTILSFACMIVLLVGAAAGWDGFDDTTTSTANSVAYYGWVFGGLGAFASGCAAYGQGRRAGHRAASRSGQIAVGYVICTALLSVVVA